MILAESAFAVIADDEWQQEDFATWLVVLSLLAATSFLTAVIAATAAIAGAAALDTLISSSTWLMSAGMFGASFLMSSLVAGYVSAGAQMLIRAMIPGVDRACGRRRLQLIKIYFEVKHMRMISL